MKLSIIRLFNGAGATGHVFTFKKGEKTNKGLAFSGIIGPMTTIAVVPTTPQILTFAIAAQTKDKQPVTVRGSITATLRPTTAIDKFDFTVDVEHGGYKGEWQKVLNALVVERAVRAVHAKLREMNVGEAIQSQKEVEDAIVEVLGETSLVSEGVSIVSCSIPKIDPDPEVAAAIGANERQLLLTAADTAVHERRLSAAENDRTVRGFEAGTALTLEEERAKLIAKQGQNKELEAAADAKATELKLIPLKGIGPGTLLGAALIEGLGRDRIGTIVIGPELLAALKES